MVYGYYYWPEADSLVIKHPSGYVMYYPEDVTDMLRESDWLYIYSRLDFNPSELEYIGAL